MTSRPLLRWTNRDRCDDERGAVAVEAVIVISLLLTLFFGVAEFGMALRSRHALSEATRTGARAAASLPRQNGYQDAAKDAIAASLADSLPSESVLNLTIYKADPVTGDPIDGTYTTCTTCWRYEWDPDTQTFGSVSAASWDADDQNACGDDGFTDYVGVWVSGEHDLVTTFWSDKINLTGRVVMRLEPVIGTAQCGP